MICGRSGLFGEAKDLEERSVISRAFQDCHTPDSFVLSIEPYQSDAALFQALQRVSSSAYQYRQKALQMQLQVQTIELIKSTERARQREAHYGRNSPGGVHLNCYIAS